MNQLFDIKNIFFTAWGYPMSYLEFFATISGGLASWLSVKENVWSWIMGIVNVIFAFAMFYQIQLYPDMFLQVFFFITNVLGFWMWKFPKAIEANEKKELRITNLNLRQILALCFITLICTSSLGLFSKNLHELFPKLFSLPSAFPYLDSFTTVVSIIATFLLMRKKLEAWWLWLFVDIISTFMYFIKDVKLYSALYGIFCIIAVFGALEWTRKWKMSHASKINA